MNYKIKIVKTSKKKSIKLNELRNIEESKVLDELGCIILSVNYINDNIDLLLKYGKNNNIKLLCEDYESALILNELINNGKIEKSLIYLLDDMEMKDRSYIDTTLFQNTCLVIPNTYAMWNVKFDEKLYVYQYRYEYDVYSDSFSGFYDREILSEVKRISSMISEFSSNLTQVEKIILVSNYLQMYCQFIEGKESHVGEDVYIVDDMKEDMIPNPTSISKEELGDPKTALFYNFGVCRTFADATTLLLNNPYLRVNARTVKGVAHVWNTIEINGKTYQLDNSRAISRGKNRMEEALRATNFNSEFLLFGEDSLEKLQHEKIDDNFITKPRSKEDFDRKYIEAAIEFLENTGLVNFNYGNEPFYEGYKKK